MIQVIVADDHPVVRRGLKGILADQSDIAIVGEAGTGQELLDKLNKTNCDVVLLDISMPGRGGLDVLSDLRRQFPRTPALVLSVHPEEQFGSRVLKAGAAGYLNKQAAPEHLVTAVRKVHGGGKYVSPSLAEKIATDLATDTGQPAHETLSDREYQIFCMISSGKTVSEIARELCLSQKTISTHRSRILDKMQLRTNAQLTFYAITNRLIENCPSPDSEAGSA